MEGYVKRGWSELSYRNGKIKNEPKHKLRNGIIAAITCYKNFPSAIFLKTGWTEHRLAVVAISRRSPMA